MRRYFRMLSLPASCLSAAAVLIAMAHAADAPRSSYTIETVAGSSRMGDGGPALAAQIGAIQGIAFDRAGNLYLSDTDHHRVRKVSPAGIISTVAGTGTAGFSGDGGPATDAQLNLPYGLSADAGGNLYIADLGNNRVRRVGLDGVITTVAGTGVKGSAGDGGPAVSARLFTPRNVLVDAAGNVFVSEFEGHRIRRIGLDGKISTAVGTGAAGFRGDGGQAGAAQLNYPAGLCLDRSGALYIADSQNNRVRKVTPSGIITTALKPSDVTVPRAVAVDAAGTMYVADGYSAVVYGYVASGSRMQLTGGPDRAFAGDGGPASKASVTNIFDLAIDQGGSLYLADDQRVRKVDPQGIIRTVAGDGYLAHVGDDGKATDVVLYRPQGVALDSSGNLLIADTGTQRVRIVSPSGIIQTLAGTGVAVRAAEAQKADTAAASGLNSPMGVTADAQGNIFIADTYNHWVRKVGPDRRIATALGTGEAGMGPEYVVPADTQLNGPRAVCFDRSGVMFVVDTANNRVLRAAPGALVEIAAGNGSSGDVGDDGPARSAQLNQPMGCAVDSFGDLFIADTMNHRIRKVAPDGTISTAAGTGAAGASGDEGPARDARLNAPRGVAVDDSGNIYMADTGNSRIRQVTPDGVIHALAGKDLAGFQGDGGPAADALLDSPAGVFLDGSGTLYIADTNNNRIRRLVAASAVPSDPLVLPLISVVNAASLQPGPVAPGEVVILSGKGIGPDSGIVGAYDNNGVLPFLLGGAQVLFDGNPAPLLYAQSGEIHAQVPYETAGKDNTHVEVFYQGRTVSSLDLTVAAAAPGLYPVAVNENGTANTSAKPAAAGSLITLYATGEGLSDSANTTGQAAQSPCPRPKLPVKVTISGAAATDVDAFRTPGIAGMLQVNVRVPASVAAGPAAVVLTVGTAASQEISVRVK